MCKWILKEVDRRQATVDICEVEYYAVCLAAKEDIYLRMVSEESGMKVDSPLVIQGDNRAISPSRPHKNIRDQSKTKYITVRHCFLHLWDERGRLELEGLDTEEQLSDIFTKALEVRHYSFN